VVQLELGRHRYQTLAHLNKVNIMTDQATPKWVNKELFHGLLEQNNNNFKAILKFVPTSAISKGENYLTIVLRIQIEMQLNGE